MIVSQPKVNRHNTNNTETKRSSHLRQYINTNPPVAIPILSKITLLNFSVQSSFSPQGPCNKTTNSISLMMTDLHQLKLYNKTTYS